MMFAFFNDFVLGSTGNDTASFSSAKYIIWPAVIEF